MVIALAAVLGMIALSAGAASAKPSAHYVVRVDPRLCPSPLCGGYWVSLANRHRTRCHDGVRRARCYVASAWPASSSSLMSGSPTAASSVGSMSSCANTSL